MALFGVNEWANWTELGRLGVRLALDLAFVFVVVQQVYFRLYRNREFVFTFYLFNVVTLCLCLLLRRVPTELGFALALFSVFGILRYRTEQIRSRDLTYLFIVIGIGIVNGVAEDQISAAELICVNAVIAGLVVILELGAHRHAEESVSLLYDRLDLLKRGSEPALRDDLAARTGLQVRRVETQRIDLLRDAAEVLVFTERFVPTEDAAPPRRPAPPPSITEPA